MLKKFLCKINYHCFLPIILAPLNVSLVRAQVCGPDDIINDLYWALPT